MSRPWCVATLALLLVASVSAGCDSGRVTGDWHSGSPAVKAEDLDLGDVSVTGTKVPRGPAEVELARDLEGQRLAEYVVDPYDVDPSYAATDVPTGLFDDPRELVNFYPRPGPLAGKVTGFAVSRKQRPWESTMNAVFRFLTPAEAARVARAMQADSLKGGSGIAYEDYSARRVRIPGHPRALATVAYFSPGEPNLDVYEAVGPHLVNVYVASVDKKPETVIRTAAAVLTRQKQRLAEFTPTPADRLTGLTYPAADLLALTLAPDDSGSSADAAVYGPLAAAHLQWEPKGMSKAFQAAGVDFVSFNAATLYRTRGLAEAKSLAKVMTAAAARRYEEASPPKGLPHARCFAVEGEPGRAVPYFCQAVRDRYLAEASGKSLDAAQQLLSAQYLLLDKA
ncbi:MAG: DUF7373 family lipoprotein [Micromonosporaceae bacterium]